MVQITLARVYDRPGPEAGFRVLVDRVWPRGVARVGAPWDVWLKELAPSTALRQWFAHDRARWEPFQERYFQELDADAPARAALEELRGLLARHAALVLLYAAKDGVQQCRGPAALSAGTRRRSGCRPRRGLALKSRSAEFFCAKGVAPGKRERAAFFRAFPDRGCPACAQKIKEVAEVGRFCRPFPQQKQLLQPVPWWGDMAAFLVLQAARFGDLVQSGRLLRGLQEQGETHLAVDAGLAPLARLLYPFAPVWELALHGRPTGAALARNREVLAQWRRQDYAAVYNCNYSGLTAALCRVFAPEQVHGYRPTPGGLLRSPWAALGFGLSARRAETPLNLVDFWGHFCAEPALPAAVNPRPLPGGGGIGVVLAGREARRSLSLPMLTQLLPAVFRLLGGLRCSCWARRWNNPPPGGCGVCCRRRCRSASGTCAAKRTGRG